jgi:PTS system N-acetylgalactosamine-specific IIB component
VIALLRVDNRLVHGQVLEAWLPRLGVRRLLVADDEASRSPLAQAAMTLAVPEEVATEVRPVETVDWAAAAAAPEKVLVLFREVGDLRRAVGRGLTSALAPLVNLGNVHHGPERRPVTPSVYLRREELDALRDLAAQGFRVEARAVPSDSPTDVEEMGRRFHRASG